MPTVHRFYLGGSLLALFLIGCDGSELVDPTMEAASSGASGPKVNPPSSTSAIAVSHSRIDVSWRDNSTNEIGFEIHRSAAGVNGAFGLLASTGAGVIGYSDGGVNHSSQYCYKVRALRSTGNKISYSEFSTAACATTPAPPIPAAPAAPTGVTAWPGGSAAAWVSWSDNSTNEAGFRVERSLDAGSTWTIAGTVGSNEYYFFDRDRASEQQVCYRISAFNDGGDSPVSNTACTTLIAAPTGLTATVVDPANMEVELTWTDNSSIEDGYEIWLDPCCGPGNPISLPANSTSFRFTWDFYADAFYVVATKDGGYSDQSNWVTPTVP